ncbi:MAG: hypothetical protein KDA37_08510 [Planctomycetales bacterium]|nr:hypothetical protein [Planctomycetales bacterium]
MAEHESDAPQQEKKKGGGGCLKGCLIVLVLLIIGGAILAYVTYKNAGAWMGGLLEAGVNAAVDGSGLPDAEKAEVKAQLERVTGGLKDGSVTLEQMGQVMEGFMNSPLMPAMYAVALDAKVDESGLSDEDKAAAKSSFQRYGSGLVNDQVDATTFEQVVQHVADKDQNGNWKLREPLSDADLQAAAEAAKTAADDAGVAEEPEAVDLSGELKKIIDGVLGGDAPALDVPAPAVEEAVP